MAKDVQSYYRRVVRINKAKQFGSNCVKVLIMLMFFIPFYWMITTSIKDYAETVLATPTLWPHSFNLEGYVNLFNEWDMWPYIERTIIITASCMILQYVTMIPAAYAFAKMDFKGSGILFTLIMIAFMLPGQVTFIASYTMFAKWGWIKTLLPQIIPSAVSAHGIFMLRQAFKQVPDELIESARLDNANELQIIFKVMMPISKHIVITILLNSFIGHWNAYFWPLIMSRTEDVRPITLLIDKLKQVGDDALHWPTIMAGNCFLMSPILFMFLFCSNFIVPKTSYSGVK